MINGSTRARNSPPGLGRPILYGGGDTHKRLAAMRRLAGLSGARLLDVGCGNGAYTEQLAPSFDETVAIDVASDHFEGFAERSEEAIVVRELGVESLDYPAAYFDAVVMIEVIEHLADVASSLSQVRRVIRDNGVLVITAPNRLFPFETHLIRIRNRRIRGRYVPFLPWVPAVHDRVADARAYTVRSLRATVEPFGFCLTGFDYVMPPFDRWSAGRRYVRPITDRLEGSPARCFGVSIVAAFRPILRRERCTT